MKKMLLVMLVTTILVIAAYANQARYGDNLVTIAIVVVLLLAVLAFNVALIYKVLKK